MSTNEAIPQDGSGEVRQPAGPQLDPIEVLPGYQFATDPPVKINGYDDIDPMLERAEGLAVDVVRTVAERIDPILENADALGAQVRAETIGRAGVSLDRGDVVAGKTVQAIRKAIDTRVGNAYGYLMANGGTYPSIEAVTYALETGDHLGALGLAAPVVDPREMAPPPAMPAMPGNVGGQLPIGGGGGAQVGGPRCPNAANAEAIGYAATFTQFGGAVLADGSTGDYPVRPDSVPPGQCVWVYRLCVSPGPGQPNEWRNFYFRRQLPLPSLTDLGGVAQGYNTVDVTYAVNIEPGWTPQRYCAPAAPPPPPPPPPPPIDEGNGGGGNNAGGPTDCVRVGMGGISPNELGTMPINGGDVVGITPWASYSTPEAFNAGQHDCYLPICAEGCLNTVELGKGANCQPDGRPVYTGTLFVPPGWKLYISPDGQTVGAFPSQPKGWIEAMAVTCAGGNNPPPPPPPPDETGKCPVPPAVACGPTFENPPKIGIDGDAFCKSIAELLGDLKFTEADFASWLKMGQAAEEKSSSIADDIVGALVGTDGPALPNILNRLAGWAAKIIIESGKGKDCQPNAFASSALWRGVLGLTQRWLNILPTGVMADVEYVVNSTCQWQIPTPPEADVMRLAGEIDRAVWLCYQKAQGNYESSAEALLQSKRQRINATALTHLMMRKRITREQYDALIKGEGYTKVDDIKRLEQSQEAWPGISDVVRFLVREADDKEIAERFETDKGFREAWGNNLADYARGAGVSEELMRLYWRSHWRLPSPTQLYNMAHRLRPGRVPEEIQVTEDDVRKALQQDDMLPWWIEREVAIAYRPITRTDSQRAFMLRTITDDEYVEQLKDVGYSHDDAVKLYEMEYKRREIMEARQSGLPTVRGLTTQFASGALTETDFRELMAQVGRPPEAIDKAVNAGRITRATAKRTAVIKQTRQSYLSGILDDGEALNALLQGGIDADAALELTRLWAELRRTRGKLAPASMLCKWRWNHLIDATQHQVALERVGWSPEDARRIVTSCEFDLSERARKQAEAMAEKERRRREREEKERRRRERLNVQPVEEPA